MDPRRDLLVKVLGGTVVDDWMICGERDQRTLRPTPSKDVAPLETTGPPEELGRLAADWLTEVVRRPMIAQDVRSAPEFFAPAGSALPPGHRWVRKGAAER